MPIQLMKTIMKVKAVFLIMVIGGLLSGCASTTSISLKEPEHSESVKLVASGELLQNVYIERYIHPKDILNHFADEKYNNWVEPSLSKSLKNYSYLGDKSARYRLTIKNKEMTYSPPPRPYNFWVDRRSRFFWIRSSRGRSTMEFTVIDSVTKSEIAAHTSKATYIYDKNYSWPRQMGIPALFSSIRKNEIELIAFLKATENKLMKLEQNKVKASLHLQRS